MHKYNESLVNRARARATGADVHGVGELVSQYHSACKRKSHSQWNIRRLEETLQLYVGTTMSLKEAISEQRRIAANRSKDSLVKHALNQLENGLTLNPNEFNDEWHETWLEACRIAEEQYGRREHEKP